MKKWVCFLLGTITGFILTNVVLLCIGMGMNKNSGPETNPNSIPGLVLFEEPGDVMDSPSFEIFQVLKSNVALARGMEKGYSSIHTGLVVLLIGDENTYFYDDQIIKVNKKQAAHHVGTYQYETKSEFQKTVPVVKILDKQ